MDTAAGAISIRKLYISYRITSRIKHHWGRQHLNVCKIYCGCNQQTLKRVCTVFTHGLEPTHNVTLLCNLLVVDFPVWRVSPTTSVFVVVRTCLKAVCEACAPHSARSYSMFKRPPLSLSVPLRSSKFSNILNWLRICSRDCNRDCQTRPHIPHWHHWNIHYEHVSQIQHASVGHATSWQCLIWVS